MNLLLHHFKKECRYLWLRWLVFLAAVAYDFPVQSLWLFPIDLSAKDTAWIPDFIHAMPAWVAAWWLMLSLPPEDTRGGLVA